MRERERRMERGGGVAVGRQTDRCREKSRKRE